MGFHTIFLIKTIFVLLINSRLIIRLSRSVTVRLKSYLYANSIMASPEKLTFLRTLAIALKLVIPCPRYSVQRPFLFWSWKCRNTNYSTHWLMNFFGSTPSWISQLISGSSLAFGIRLRNLYDHAYYLQSRTNGFAGLAQSRYYRKFLFIFTEAQFRCPTDQMI